MKNKKLKKVLTIILYCFVGFFTALGVLCFGGLMYSKATGQLDNYLGKNKQLLTYDNNIATKRVVEVDVSGSEKYRFYSINDLTSYDVMTNMYNYDRNHGNFFETSPHNFTFTPNNVDNNYIVDGGNTAHNDETGFQLKYRISGCAFSWTENNYRIIMSSDFTICGLNSTTTLGHLHVNNVRYKFNGVLSQSTCSYFHDSTDTGLTLLLNNSFYIRALQTNQNYNLFDFLGFGNQVTDSSAYDVGYQSGYITGKSDGYNEGYISGNTGMTNNPFNLIRNAFQGVASILNIQVLPNLSLGVLIFAPLIVTIIIVVVKMIRG